MNKAINPKLKVALELGPLLLFFVGFRVFKDRSFTVGGMEYSGFVAMTAVLVFLIVVSSALLWRMTGKLSRMQLMTLVLVVVLGGVTIWLNDPRYIKMKPTLLYLLFAGILGFGLLRGRSYLALVMEDALPIAPEGWMILTRRFAAFFVALALMNEVIWRNFSDEVWVDFKTFGIIGAMALFFVAQGGLLKKYGTDDQA